MKRTLLLFLFVAAALPLFSRSSTITMTVDYPGSNVSYSPRTDNAGNPLPPLEVSNQLDVLPRSGGATLTIENDANSEGKLIVWDAEEDTVGITTIAGTLQLTAKTLQTAPPDNNWNAGLTDDDDKTHSVIVGKGEPANVEGPLGGATFETLTIKDLGGTEETPSPITLGTDELVLPRAEALELYPGKVQNPQLPACSSVKWEKVVNNKVFLTCN